MSEAQLQKLEAEKVALQAELNSIKQAEAPKQVAGKVCSRFASTIPPLSMSLPSSLPLPVSLCFLSLVCLRP
jgi:hypothetical protein